ncbi:hypothetical protein Tco_1164392 [Tanacetum coccineum]
MDITKAEQIALDDALVAPANRLKIGKCNLRLSSDLTSKEATLQVVYDVLKLTPFYKAFQASADVLEIYMQEFWAIDPFITIRFDSIQDEITKKHIVILSTSEKAFNCPNIWRDKDDYSSMSTSYINPGDHLLRLSTSVSVKSEFDTTPKEKPPTDPKDKRGKQTSKITSSGKQKQPATGLETLSEIALTETEQLKIATKRSQIQTLNSQASGLGDGVDILSKVPDEQVHEKTSIDEGAGDKLEVPNVPKHHSNSEEESWTFSDDDDDDDDDDDEDDDPNKDSDAHDDDDDDDNDATDRYGGIDNIIYPNEKQKDDDRVKDGEEDKEGDVTNVNLEGGDVDMTDTDTTKDTEDAHVTLMAATLVVQQQSSSVSDLVSKFISPTTDDGDSKLPLQYIPSTSFSCHSSKVKKLPFSHTTTTNPFTTPLPIPNFAYVFGFNQRVTALESDLSKLKQSNPFTEAISSILGIVNEYLGSKMKEAADVAIQLKSNSPGEEVKHEENQEFLNSLDSNM